MKIKTYLLGISLALGLIAGSANAALMTSDSNYLGSVQDGAPASFSTEVGYINYLLDMTAPSVEEPCAVDSKCTRSSNDSTGWADATTTDAFRNDSPAASGEVTLSGYDWLLGKYGGISHIWYVGDLSGTVTLPNPDPTLDSGLSHWSLFNLTDCDPNDPSSPGYPCDGGRVPEPGMLPLLGIGLIGFALARRRMK